MTKPYIYSLIYHSLERKLLETKSLFLEKFFGFFFFFLVVVHIWTLLRKVSRKLLIKEKLRKVFI